MGPVNQLRVAGGSAYIVEMIMLTFMLLSGIAVAYFRLSEASGKTSAKKQWILMLAIKTLLFIFLTPITEMIVLSWVGTVGQSVLSENEVYFVRTVKFIIVTIAFVLALYMRIYREDLTTNFTKPIGTAQEEQIGVKQPLLQVPGEL